MSPETRILTDIQAREALLASPTNTSLLAPLIDSTLLRPDATASEIIRLCEEAVHHSFAAVCVSPCYVKVARRTLDAFGSDKTRLPKVCTVVSFPHGQCATAAKEFETLLACNDGAEEIDFVQNVGLVRDGRWDELAREAKSIVAAGRGALVKMILETSLLAPDEFRPSIDAALDGGVHVIKTSTGFGARGASPADIELIARLLAERHAHTGIQRGIKASGGVRTSAVALQFVRAGATRLGTSCGAALVSDSSTTQPGAY